MYEPHLSRAGELLPRVLSARTDHRRTWCTIDNWPGVLLCPANTTPDRTVPVGSHLSSPLTGHRHTQPLSSATRVAKQLARPSDIPTATLEYDALLAQGTEQLVVESAMELAGGPIIWREEGVIVPTKIRLRALDRLGGVPGLGGSRVFVGFIEGIAPNGQERSSISLLLKVVEGNKSKAKALLREKERYDEIHRFLNDREIARSLLGQASHSSAVLWTEFFGDHMDAGMPVAAPTELRHMFEHGYWSRCVEILRATYDILGPAHSRESRTKDINFVEMYRQYLRLDRGYTILKQAVGDSDYVEVFNGVIVRNPCAVLKKLIDKPFIAGAWCGCVHGDLHPRNVMCSRRQKACLIDWGWARIDEFHVIVDFVLMELSLKFFYLPWGLDRDAVALWERNLCDEWRTSQTVGDKDIDGATRVIHAVRKHAERYITDFRDENALTAEYYLPLFLLTMGSFAFAQNVRSLDHLILSAGLLASRIEEQVGLDS